MEHYDKRNLDGSWDFAVDEGNISWAEETSSQEPDIKVESRDIPPESAYTSRPDSRRVAALEPELVMPSLETSSSQTRRRPVPRQPEPERTLPRQRTPQVANPQRVPQRRHEREGSAMGDIISDAAGNSLQFVFDIVGQTLRTLKTPISWILAAYALAAFVTFTQNLVTSSVYNALSPVCRLPGASYLNLPMCQYAYSSTDDSIPKIAADQPVPAPEFEALMATQQQFEEILSDQSHAVGLPMDMKRSETSIRDLRQVVRFSTIPSKNELLHEFDGFVETARIASYDLQKFNSHVGRGVDAVLSTAKWTQRVLDDIDLKYDEQGLLPAFVRNTILAPFQPVQFTEARLLNQYIEHTHIVSGEIEKLIDEAQILLQTLQNLEDRLEVIHSISLRDDQQVSSNKEEVLGHLWSKIGGNRAQRQKFERQLELLRQVGRYRKSAFTHVANTIIKLQGMQTELEELRTRVGSAAAAQDAGAKHVPLSVHIENIRLGVERLEIGRERARELEQKQSRRVLEASVNDGASDVKYLSPN